MGATTSQLVGLRRARRRAESQHHLLKPFRQTPDSKAEDTQFGNEFVAECRYCTCYMIVYFPLSREEMEDQDIDPARAEEVVSYRYNHTSRSLMLLSGTWDSHKCGEKA